MSTRNSNVWVNGLFFKTKEYFNLNANLPKGFEEFCLRPGFFMSTYINDSFIPSHHASHVCGVEKSIPLTKEETVKYLRGESLSLNKKYPDGYYNVCYLDMNLGVVHVVNGTAKNLYPKGLRINADIETSF